VAPVRVYCGVTAAESDSWLAASLVDDDGRLLDVRHISDDPAGYALLAGLLTNRSTAAAPVAIDSHGHLMTQLLAAANRPVCIIEEPAVTDVAERFSGDDLVEQTRLTISHRRAVGLARALRAGVIHATTQRSTWDLDEIKPVLLAHTAAAAGRNAAADALRDVLRELYPAALRAFADPADLVPLRILEALPEPSMLSASPSSRNRDAAIVAELSSSGVADTTTAVSALNALRMAVGESPRWNANRHFAPTVAETVRQSVAAVRACDCACAALVAALVERLSAIHANSIASPRPYLLPTAPISPAPRRINGPAAEIPPSRLAPRVSAASAAASGIAPTNGTMSGGMVAADLANGITTAGAAALAGGAAALAGGAALANGAATSAGAAMGSAGVAMGSVPIGQVGGGMAAVVAGIPAPRPTPGVPPPGSRTNWPLVPGDDDDMAIINVGAIPTAMPPSGANGHVDNGYATNGYTSNGYTSNGSAPAGYANGAQPPTGYTNGIQTPAGYGVPIGGRNGRTPGDVGATSTEDLVTALSFSSDPLTAPLDRPVSPGRVPPPWLADDMSLEPASPRPAAVDDPAALPTRRPVVPGPTPTGAVGVASARSLPDALVRPMAAPGSPAVPGPLTAPTDRLVPPGMAPPAHAPSGLVPSAPLPTRTPQLGPVGGADGSRPGPDPSADDTGLLIFSQTQSAWFIAPDAAEALNADTASWGQLADEGWRTAGQAANPTVGSDTRAGLPRRVPQANLVPGSATPPRRPQRIIRDANRIAAQTASYFRGWRRGQELGGISVGKRDRTAWEFNRDQRTHDTAGHDRARLST
jgi:hypothetical protein